jgi:hypothetical protein
MIKLKVFLELSDSGFSLNFPLSRMLIYAGRGNASGQQPFALIFGLGSQTTINSVTVQWPDAAKSRTTVKNHRLPDIFPYKPFFPHSIL